MSDIKDHKAFWKRSTMEIITYTEGTLAEILQLARKDILSLITTIESQKEELEKLDYLVDELNKSNKAVNNMYDRANIQIESLKAITELAVNTMESIHGEYFYRKDSIAFEKTSKTLKEIKRLQNGAT